MGESDAFEALPYPVRVFPPSDPADGISGLGFAAKEDGETPALRICGIWLRNASAERRAVTMVEARIGGSPNLVGRPRDLLLEPGEAAEIEFTACPILLYPNTGEVRVRRRGEGPLDWRLEAKLVLISPRLALPPPAPAPPRRDATEGTEKVDDVLPGPVGEIRMRRKKPRSDPFEALPYPVRVFPPSDPVHKISRLPFESEEGSPTWFSSLHLKNASGERQEARVDSVKVGGQPNLIATATPRSFWLEPGESVEVGLEAHPILLWPNCGEIQVWRGADGAPDWRLEAKLVLVPLERMEGVVDTGLLGGTRVRRTREPLGGEPRVRRKKPRPARSEDDAEVQEEPEVRRGWPLFLRPEVGSVWRTVEGGRVTERMVVEVEDVADGCLLVQLGGRRDLYASSPEAAEEAVKRHRTGVLVWPPLGARKVR